MKIPVIKPTSEEMLACVARANDIRGTNDGFIDSGLPGCDRSIFNYLAFAGEGPGANNPSGDTAKPALGHLEPGFTMGFVKASPGNGVPTHVHDTNETFLVLEGKWKISWEGDKGMDSVELGRYDLISIPPHISRGFENLEAEPGKEQGVLLGVIAGDKPIAEMSRQATGFLVEHGRVPSEQLKSFEEA